MSGRFVWFELSTTDSDAAAAFYRTVVGWEVQAFEESPSPTPYRMWVSPQGPLGGVMTLDKESRAKGIAPHWWAHIDVEDIDAAVARVTRLGGEVHVPPCEIPGVGRFSIVTDPQAAMFSVFQPNPTEETPRDRTKHGEFCWTELHARDGKAALAFYRDLFDWAVLEELDMGPAGSYSIFGQGDTPYGGIMTATTDSGRLGWMYYVNVDDVDRAIAQTEAAGGQKLYGPVKVPGGARIAHLKDPQGAVLGISG